MDNSIDTNRCTSSIASVREQCLQAHKERHYSLFTMRNVMRVSLQNSTIKLAKSGCFSTGVDEFHCTGCHTQTLCTEPLHDSSNQTLTYLLNQSVCCIHRFHSRECASYASYVQWWNATCSPSTPQFSLSSAGAGAESQKPVISIKNVARGGAATLPETSLPIAQVAASGNQSDSPTLRELRTRIPTTNVPFTMSNPAYPLCTTDDNRLRTFNNWPSTAPEICHTLASAGFLYKGESDRTHCFCCNGIIYNWGETDNPFAEHAVWFPECEWIIHTKGHGFINRVQNMRQARNLVAPLRQEYNTTDKASHPNFDCVDDRLATVEIGRSCSAETAHNIARAGFLLITDVDSLCCFFCDGKITEWRTIQDFVAVHLRKYPECQFIKYLYSSLIEAVVGNGRHTNDCVLKALRIYSNQYPGLACIDRDRLELIIGSIETSQFCLPDTEAQQATEEAPRQEAVEEVPRGQAAEVPQDTYDDQALMNTPAARALLEFNYSTAQILNAMHEMSSANTIGAHTLKAVDIMTFIATKEEQNSSNQ